MVLRDGTIDESGSYTELMALRGSFSQLIEEYSVKENVSQDASGSGANTVDAKTDQGISSEKAVAAITSQEDDTAEESDADLISKEVIAEGSIGWNVFKSYARAATWFFAILSILGFIFSQATQIGVNLWLEKWAGAPDQYPLGVFLGVYGALVACYIVLDLGVNMTIFILGGIRASTVIHNRLLDRMLRLPMSVGRIVNRFSSDMDNIDELIPFNISDTYFFLMTVLGVLIVIASSVPIFLAVIPVIAIAFGLTQLWYIRASRSLKRIHSISKSPLYQHFSETLAGVSTIRAMQITDRFILDNAAKSDDSANAFFVYEVAQRWLHFRLENMAAVITFITALLAVHTLGPSMAGLVISYALNLTFPMTQLVTAYSELQNQLISVERVEEYSTKNEEAPATLPSDGDLPPDWPNQGRIVIQHYSTRYREGMDLVLKDISLEIQPKERVGVVGRTGAGKSSLTLALFRIVEAANSHWAKASHNGPDSTSTLTSSPVGTGETKDAEESDKSVDLKEIKAEDKVGGAILIDGVDISTVGLERLRKHLAIIPQDPILFAGTLRDNLDPFTEATDAELWEALERAHLKTHISTLEGGLSAEVAQNGENFSVGQRSLICLARALLRKTKILILDEATAAVDVETDDLIQQTIRKEFKDRTILTIAHRIKTIMDSDKILVLERGRVQEFGTPSDLLQSQGLFYSLAKQAGQA
ncbi:Multidrug resistance-associated protein 1 [Mortierella sp. GBA43]|nr:Multidrug resistance-associated protein 1 [Mortierella sp. GBA43]